VVPNSALAGNRQPLPAGSESGASTPKEQRAVEDCIHPSGTNSISVIGDSMHERYQSEDSFCTVADAEKRLSSAGIMSMSSKLPGSLCTPLSKAVSSLSLAIDSKARVAQVCTEYNDVSLRASGLPMGPQYRPLSNHLCGPTVKKSRTQPPKHTAWWSTLLLPLQLRARAIVAETRKDGKPRSWNT
jgi:hypothetical protein